MKEDPFSANMKEAPISPRSSFDEEEMIEKAEDIVQMACLVVYSTPQKLRNEIGRLYELSKEPKGTLIGSENLSDIQVPANKLFPYNLRIFRDGDNHWYFENLVERHNNILVNRTLSRGCRLRDGDRLKVGEVTFRFLDGIGEESTFYQNVNRLIGTDALTEVNNRRGLEERLLSIVAYCHRNDHPFSIAVIDFDDFRNINNKYSHFAGDQALHDMAQRIRQNIRAEDVFGRPGGEEFVLGLPNLDKEKAVQFMERLRRKVTATPIFYQDIPLHVTFSTGVSENSDNQANPKKHKEVLREIRRVQGLADTAMYEAKRLGKNQVVGWHPDLTPKDD